MDKKQKYYNYVVDDLVKNTKIIYSSRNTLLNRVSIPFGSSQLITMSIFKTFLGSPITSTFVGYVGEMYGAQDTANDNDVYPLWKMYGKRMIDKINNV